MEKIFKRKFALIFVIGCLLAGCGNATEFALDGADEPLLLRRRTRSPPSKEVGQIVRWRSGIHGYLQLDSPDLRMDGLE